MEHARYRQVHRGVPVTAGEIIVHLRGAEVTAVTAKTLPGIESLKTTPTVTPEQALTAAEAILAKHLNVTDATLSKPRLEIFNRGLLVGRETPTQLAWFIEARKIDVREFIWVDAQRGGVLLHFSQLADAKSRAVHDTASTSTLPGTLVRSEGGAATGDPDADAAYNFSGDTYDYFFNQHSRDSYDGAGALLRSTVDYCPAPAQCPYGNAFWNGTQMVYGFGFSRADDVDAHELTHAVTEHSANLFYYMQSGALNESFSDIFGETVDLGNGAGNDAPAVRWLAAEDLPGIGAIRNMMVPTQFSDPGKMSDPQLVCETPGLDGGGVHSNSGIPNHAYALMVDGGTYNGQTITGIGLTKAGKIQYRALTAYLLTGSDFLDNYNALQQACTDLIGTAGISAADCGEVKKALDAVEMANPFCGQPATPALCPVGEVPTSLFFDDLENPSSGNWTTTTASGVNHWLDATCPDSPNIYCAYFATSGALSFWGYNYNTVGDSSVAMTANVSIPAGGARMQFNHSFGFDNDTSSNFDGGVIEYSTSNGTSWADAGPLISAGKTYGGTVASGGGNPLAGRSAFVKDSFGYTASQLNLVSLAGQNARFRFRLGTDRGVDDYGWFIDDVRIYTCAVPPSADLALTKTDGVTSAIPGQPVTYTITASNAGPSAAPTATVADTFPASCVTPTWTCVGAGGGTCTSSGSGNISDKVNLPAGGSVIYTASCSIAPTATGTLSNTATVSSSITDPTPGNNSATDSDTLAPSTDLALTKTDSPDPVIVGNNLTYTITASNNGPSAATGVTVTDTLPANVTLVSATASQGSCSGASTISCNLGNLNNGANATATIVVTPTVAGVLSNTASVNGTESDPSSGNNSATATTTVNSTLPPPPPPVSADLAITKIDSSDPVIVGNVFAYTMTVTNNGPGAATGVVVSDTLPAGVTFIQAAPSQGTCTGTTTVTCNLGSLNNAGTATVKLYVIPTAAGLLSNSASVSGTNNDPNSANNQASESTTVNMPSCNGLTATIVGTIGNDTLDGTAGRDIIVGLSGNDVINGLDGNDVICGGLGNDIIRGGNGNDLLRGEEGRDTLAGGSGRDRLEGGAGNDRLNGGTLSDTCIGGPGTDTATACESISSVP